MIKTQGVGWLVAVYLPRIELIDFLDWMDENCPSYRFPIKDFAAWHNFKPTLYSMYTQIANQAQPDWKAYVEVWVWNDRDVIAMKMRWNIKKMAWSRRLSGDQAITDDGD